jgi:hypothetical protein
LAIYAPANFLFWSSRRKATASSTVTFSSSVFSPKISIIRFFDVVNAARVRGFWENFGTCPSP